MYKCISLWLIVLTIIMTFCVSHQNQIDNGPSESTADNLVTSTDIKEESRLNNTENIILGKQEKIAEYLKRILGANSIVSLYALLIITIIVRIFWWNRKERYFVTVAKLGLNWRLLQTNDGAL